MDAAALTRIAARGWPAIETAPLGAWELRASSGFTRRANSVLALGDPGMPLDTAISHVQSWYAARGLPAYFHAIAGTPLDEALGQRGWSIEAPVDFQTGPLSVPGKGRGDVEITDAPNAAWIARYHKATLHESAHRVLAGGSPLAATDFQRRGSPLAATDFQRRGSPLQRRGDCVFFAAIADAANPSRARAIGRCVIVDAWAGFSAIEVDPAHRRQGLALAIMHALVTRAVHLGAANAYLQVESDNTAALALYAGLRFTTHHRYHYRREP